MAGTEQENTKIHRSKKGFIAIDLDGTALVQKIDKNKWYGVTHNRSDLRKSLVELHTERSGTDFVNTIWAILKKIPVLGYYFKTEGEKLTEGISAIGTFYAKTRHYQRDLDSIVEEPNAAFASF